MKLKYLILLSLITLSACETTDATADYFKDIPDIPRQGASREELNNRSEALIQLLTRNAYTEVIDGEFLSAYSTALKALQDTLSDTKKDPLFDITGTKKDPTFDIMNRLIGFGISEDEKTIIVGFYGKDYEYDQNTEHDINGEFYETCIRGLDTCYYSKAGPNHIVVIDRASGIVVRVQYIPS